MKAFTPRTFCLLPPISCFQRSVRYFIYAIALSIVLGGCTTTPGFHNSNHTWKTYRNARYGFEFPYPGTWKSLPSDNADGIVFISPRNNAVEIRSWAGMQLPEDITQDKTGKTSINPNFTTAQGVSGVLTVEVRQQESVMTLQLVQGQLKYYWQGKAPSPEFSSYYRFFYYIASSYRISQGSTIKS
ncbi:MULTISPECIES: hypothetical protein [Fischerella]|uniref:Uncharacterized protein n=1 Tax=Fischerella muscicola CCMEE 5323 TaxID=2019572 RepID=A0A2N6K7A2_FISMU|nr:MULTISPECIES: hypothetical protein [Fischerella]MBD2432833.1 hypothetical protein [Fischerella sp. FACHB-380]PLZ93105.1 hypothetical protein CEN44_04140 [Fischerella muscicola CCMEE 5323]